MSSLDFLGSEGGASQDAGRQESIEMPSAVVIKNLEVALDLAKERAAALVKAKPFDKFADTAGDIRREREKAEKAVAPAGARVKLALAEWKGKVSKMRGRFESMAELMASATKEGDLPRAPLAVNIGIQPNGEPSLVGGFWQAGVGVTVVDSLNAGRFESQKGSMNYVEYMRPAYQAQILVGLGAVSQAEEASFAASAQSEADFDALITQVAARHGAAVSADAYEVRLPTSAQGFEVIIKKGRLDASGLKLSNPMLGAYMTRKIELDFENALRERGAEL